MTKCETWMSLLNRYLENVYTNPIDSSIVKKTPWRYVKPLENKRFGHWVVLERDKQRRKTSWICICDCGKKGVVSGYALKNEKSTGCGCVQYKNTAKRQTKHGHGSRKLGISLTFRSWVSMKTRCYNKKSQKYPIYGGRGITICDRWLESYQNFLDDMGERPSVSHSIDRYPNNDGNYEPGNCRWATKGEQVRNRSNSHWIEYAGMRMVLTDWARFFGLKSPGILYVHLNNGVSFSDIYAKYTSHNRKKTA